MPRTYRARSFSTQGRNLSSTIPINYNDHIVERRRTSQQIELLEHSSTHKIEELLGTWVTELKGDKPVFAIVSITEI